MLRTGNLQRIIISGCALGIFCASSIAAAPYAYGLVSRAPAKPYIAMPGRAAGPIPSLLSQTGAFRDLASLSPAGALIPYDINVSFWSDGAQKRSEEHTSELQSRLH